MLIEGASVNWRPEYACSLMEHQQAVRLEALVYCRDMMPVAMLHRGLPGVHLGESCQRADSEIN